MSLVGTRPPTVIKQFQEILLKEQRYLLGDNGHTPSLFEKNFILPKEREEGIAVGN